MPKRLLDDNLKNQLVALMPRIIHDVEIVSSLDERDASADLELLLDDIAILSPKITHRRDDEAHLRRPSFSINRVGTSIGVSFAGIPMGHEFSSLVLALLQVGGNPIKESPEVIKAVEELDGDFEFITYMSLTCQNCPTVVQVLNTMSVINPRIRHTAVEGSLFGEEIAEHNVLAVPTIWLNGKEWGQGRTTIEDFIKRLDTGAVAREAARLNEKDPYDALVVGQGPAGVSAAIYLARKGLRTGLAGERFGGQVLDTMAIENFISQPYTEGPRYAGQLEEHVRAYDIDVINSQVATRLVPATGTGQLHTVEFGDDARLQAKEIVIATGARWRLMGVPGEQEYRNKGVTFCPHCDAPLFKGKKVAVIGGGNSGIEAAIDIAVHASEVIVLEFADSCRADDVLMDKLASLPNTSVITSARTTEVLGDGTQVTGLTYVDRTDDTTKSLEVSGIFVQIGLLPNTEWVADVLTINELGEIATDAHGATSVEGIFAAGDCSSTPYKQIVIAQGSGAAAALGAWDHLIRSRAQS